MSTLDLRSNEGNPVTEIIFGKGKEHLEYKIGSRAFTISDGCVSDSVQVLLEDIPLLIKALQKAQELWGSKD